MTTLPNMNLVLPTQGVAGAGVWDDVQDANSALIDAHDHSTGKGVTVKTAGISINADLTFASLYAPINLHRLTFASIVALTGSNKSLFVNTADNELYWRSNAGTNVKLTAGSALNVAAFTGGIGGDYASIGALADYDDATDTYRLRQETASAVRQFAKVSCADLRLTEYKASGVTPVPSAAVTIKSPAALGSSYSVTMPAAVPGSTSLVQMDSAGVLTASNTVANALTLSAALTVNNTISTNNTITTTSTVATIGSDLTSNAHRVRLKAPAALAADYDVTMPGALPSATQVMRMSSAGVVTAASASETRTFGAAFGVPSSLGGSRNTGATTGGGYISLGTSTGLNWLPLMVSVGEVITAWSIRVLKTSATGTISAVLKELDTSDNETTIGTSATNGAASPGPILLFKSGLSATVASDKSYHIDVNGGGTTGDTIVQYQVTVTVSP